MMLKFNTPLHPSNSPATLTALLGRELPQQVVTQAERHLRFLQVALANESSGPAPGPLEPSQLGPATSAEHSITEQGHRPSPTVLPMSITRFPVFSCGRRPVEGSWQRCRRALLRPPWMAWRGEQVGARPPPSLSQASGVGYDVWSSLLTVDTSPWILQCDIGVFRPRQLWPRAPLRVHGVRHRIPLPVSPHDHPRWGR